MSATSCMRSFLEIAIARSLPPLMCGSVASSPFMMTWVWPPMVSVTACEPPL
ncbi:Uncharacterised protein [Achromobacter xylosoxidans]|nr:Uncharacterised protein [Achromobacter xylosoxidans]